MFWRQLGKQRANVRSTNHSAMVETLESRELLSVTPITNAPLTAKLARVAPANITAGKTGTVVMTIHNANTIAETEAVSLTILPSLDGVTADGSEALATVSTSVTINKRGNKVVRIPLTVPSDLPGGKYFALANGSLGDAIVSVPSKATFNVIGAVTTPSLVNKYTGIIEGETHSGTFGGSKTIHEAGFILQVSGQTLTSLSALVVIGTSGNTTGTLVGSELSNGKFSYSFAASNMNFTMTGRLVAGGKFLEGNFNGTLVGNLFSSINGAFKLTLQAS